MHVLLYYCCSSHYLFAVAEYDAAIEAYNNGSYIKDCRTFLSMVDQGQATAQYTAEGPLKEERKLLYVVEKR